MLEKLQTEEDVNENRHNRAIDPSVFRIATCKNHTIHI